MTTSPTIPPGSPAPPPRRAGAGPGLKVLFGCAIGCAVVGVLVFLAVGGGVWWLVAPGEQVATEGVAGGESLAAVHFDDLNEDPGTRALLERAVVAAQRADDRRRAEEMPERLRWLDEMARAQRGGASGLGMWIPRGATVTIEAVDGDESALLVALNLAAFPRMIRAVVRRIARSEEGGGPVRERYRGHDIDVFPGGAALAFAESTMLWSERPEVVRRALDRLEDGPEAGSISGLVPADADGRWDVRGALLDHDGTLGGTLAETLSRATRPEPEGGRAAEPEVLEAPERAAAGGGVAAAGTVAIEAPPSATVEVEPPAPPIERMTFALDVATADRMEAEIRLDCASEAGAREWLARLEESLRRFESDRGRGALAATISGTVEGPRLRAAIEVTGVDAWIEAAVADWTEQPPEGDRPAEPPAGGAE